MESAIKDCPKCRLVNPGTAEMCDCGYSFTQGVQLKPIQGKKF